MYVRNVSGLCSRFKLRAICQAITTDGTVVPGIPRAAFHFLHSQPANDLKCIEIRRVRNTLATSTRSM